MTLGRELLRNAPALEDGNVAADVEKKDDGEGEASKADTLAPATKYNLHITKR